MELPTNRTDFLIQIIAIFEANDWPRFKLYYSQALLIKDRFSLKSLKSGKKDKDSNDEVIEDVKEIEVVKEKGAGNEEAKQEPAREFNSIQEQMLSSPEAVENFLEELQRQNSTQA